MKKRKGKDWLFTVWKLNDIKNEEGKPIGMFGNYENYGWPSLNSFCMQMIKLEKGFILRNPLL